MHASECNYDYGAFQPDDYANGPLASDLHSQLHAIGNLDEFFQLISRHVSDHYQQYE